MRRWALGLVVVLLALGEWVGTASAGGAVSLPITMGERSSGIMYMSWSDAAGTAGTTANLLVSQDSASKPITAATNANNVVGIALATASSGELVDVAFQGVVDCIAANTITVGNLIAPSTGTAGRCADLATATASVIGSETQIIGYALTTATVGNPFSVYLTMPGIRGTIPAAVSEAGLFLSDVTTNNVTIGRHGFAPKLSNVSTQYLSGTGVYSAPAAVTSIATTAPITGGTITSTGTIACATCVTSAAALTSGQLVAGAGSQASAVTNLTGDVTTSGGVATTIASNAVTTAKILDANVTLAKIVNVSAASKLLGRGDSGAGVPQEITLGSGLAMTGTTLSSSGGSGAPTGASYVTLGTDATLTAERVLTAGTSGPGIALVDGGAGSTITVDIAREQWGVLAADQNATTTTLADVTGLLCTIGASATEIWQFEIQAYLNGPVAGDYKFGWNTMPSGASMSWGSHSATPNADYWGPTATMTTAPTTLEGPSGVISMAASNTSFDGFFARGFILGGGTGGAIQFRFAQGTGPSGTSTIKKGSVIICRKVIS